MLDNILNKDCCKVGLRAKTKQEVLRILADLAVKSELLSGISADEIFNHLREREDQGSTGFGNEIAIPHARIEGMKGFIVYIAVFPKGVDFEAIDRKRVKIIFVILGPAEAVNDHLKILAAISRTLGNTHVKNELLKAHTNTALYESFLRNFRGISSGPGEKRKMKLVIAILYLDEFLYDILEFFLQEGIEGATILESSGMGEYISNVPLFADFIGFMSEKKNRSKTIITLVPEDKVQDVISGIEEITGDLDKKQGAMILTTDITAYKGSMKMM
jgi:nitrogen PTS system EIIA component